MKLIGSRKPAFSLIELLAVLAIFSVLAVFSVSSLSSFSRSGNMNTGVVRVMNALTQARTEAIARNTGVQFRVVVSDPSDSTTAGRVYSLWARKKDGSMDYEQISPWERLPDTVSLLSDTEWFDAVKTGKDDLQGANSIQSTNSLTGVGYRGKSVEVLLMEFGPNGGVRLPKPAQTYSYLLLAPTVPSSDGVFTIDGRASEVRPDGQKNWRQVRISNLTGQMRLNSPES